MAIGLSSSSFCSPGLGAVGMAFPPLLSPLFWPIPSPLPNIIKTRLPPRQLANFRAIPLAPIGIGDAIGHHCLWLVGWVILPREEEILFHSSPISIPSPFDGVPFAASLHFDFSHSPLSNCCSFFSFFFNQKSIGYLTSLEKLRRNKQLELIVEGWQMVKMPKYPIFPFWLAFPSNLNAPSIPIGWANKDILVCQINECTTTD